MTISKVRTKDGRLRFRVRVKSGRAVVASKTFEKEREAKRWEADQKRALEGGEWIDPRAGKEPLGSAVERWMTARQGTVASSTFKSDRDRLRYLPPALLKRPLSSITSADLQGLLDALSRQGLSPKTVARVRALLGAFYGWAKGQRLVASTPPTRTPKGTGTHEAAEVYPFRIEDLREVVAELVARAPRQGTLALVMGLTGLRWGELAALRVRDVVSVPFPALRVARSAPDGHDIRTTTKGGRTRVVPLADEVAPLVQSWAAGKESDALLFTTDSGSRLNNSNWRRIVGWPQSCRGRRIHDLRHTAATLWLGMGVDVKSVQGWLGHESAQLTLDLYGHFRGTDADAAALARINAALSGNPAAGGRSGDAAPNLRAVEPQTRP